MSDEELLRAYATHGSESAFTELVQRHAGAVQAAALRQTGNPHLAEEVTHAVFLQLARKAGSLRPSIIDPYRHGRGANYLFADWHVESVPAAVLRSRIEANDNFALIPR